jgi:hypothetical protein
MGRECSARINHQVGVQLGVVNMRINTITVKSIIVHEIPQHYSRVQSPSAGAILSDVVSPLNTQIKTFFKEKILGSLGRSALDVEVDPSATSRSPQIIASMLSSQTSKEFVAASQELAKVLYDSQSGGNPTGLLAVLQLEIDGRDGIGIAKLEKDEGTRVKMVTIASQQTLSVEFLPELMLTGKTKVFKVGVFALGESGRVEGRVCDQQQTNVVHVAYFFLQRFLGFRLKQLPEVITERFFRAGEQFINADITSSEDKAKFHLALLSELSSNDKTVTPEAFAKSHLPTIHRAPFIAALRSADVPVTVFPKDLRRIESTLKKIQWNFEGGALALAPANQVGGAVTVETVEDGRTQLRILDRLSAEKSRS